MPKYDQIPIQSAKRGDSIIHDTDHNHPNTHTNPHAHNIRIPRGKDETYLDYPRELNTYEQAIYNKLRKLRLKEAARQASLKQPLRQSEFNKS